MKTNTPPSKDTAKPNTPAAAKTPGSDNPEAGKPVEEKELGVPALEFVERNLNLPARAKTPPAAPPKKEGDDELPKPAARPAARRPAPAAAPVFNATEMGEAIGKEVAKAIKPPAAEPKPGEGDQLNDREKRRLVVLAQMEKQFGDQYRGIVERYKASQRELLDYAKQWKEEHPGEEFDENAEEHGDFRDALEAKVEWDDEDFADALSEVKLAQKSDKPDEKTKVLQERVDRMETKEKRAERLNTERPAIIANRDKVGNKFWEKMGDEFSEVLTAEGAINSEALAVLKDSDPDTHAEVTKAASTAEFYATETYLLDNNLVDFDKENPAHKFLVSFAGEKEEQMVQRDPEQQLDGKGRSFLPRADYNKLKPEQRKAHWTFSYEDLGFLIATKIAKDTKAKLERDEAEFARRAQHRGLPYKQPSTLRPPATRQPKPALERDEHEEKPDSPSSVVAPRLAARRAAAAPAETSGLGGFVSRALGK